MGVNLKFRDPILHVEVTKRDWTDARALSAAGAGHYECCPNVLACNRALRRKFRRHTDLRAEVVGKFDIYDGNSFVGAVVRPKEAQKIIVAFDNEKNHKPILASFDLDLRDM